MEWPSALQVCSLCLPLPLCLLLPLPPSYLLHFECDYAGSWKVSFLKIKMVQYWEFHVVKPNFLSTDCTISRFLSISHLKNLSLTHTHIKLSFWGMIFENLTQINVRKFLHHNNLIMVHSCLHPPQPSDKHLKIQPDYFYCPTVIFRITMWMILFLHVEL